MSRNTVPQGLREALPRPPVSASVAPDRADQARHAGQHQGRSKTRPRGSNGVAADDLKTAKKYTPAQKRHIRQLIEYLYTHGHNVRQIQDRLQRGNPTAKVPVPSYVVSKPFISRIIKEVQSEWSKDADRDRAHWKNAQIKRLYRHLAKAQEADDLNAISKFEAQLADLQGTRDAIKVDHSVVQTKAMQVVFMNADDSSLLRELQEALEEQKLLREAKGKLLLEAKIVEDPPASG